MPFAALAAVVVHIANFTFSPAAVTVRPGDLVTWVNDDDVPHLVVADDKSFKSKPLDTGDRFTEAFPKVGVVPYFCGLHPHMVGKVVVRP